MITNHSGNVKCGYCFHLNPIFGYLNEFLLKIGQRESNHFMKSFQSFGKLIGMTMTFHRDDFFNQLKRNNYIEISFWIKKRTP